MKRMGSISMKKKAKKCVGSASLDKMSELPQVLLPHIQYFLSPKQAAQTITLSKAWQNTWSNRPNIDLNEDSFVGTEDEFLSLVDSTLQGYNDHKLRINAFQLVFSELDSESRVSLLEKWIPIVIHMGVKMFHLNINIHTSTTYYDLPLVVFESESIIDLSLEGCWLDCDDKVIMFKHLKVVKLSHVYIEEKIFDRITSSCPLIEDMQLVECGGLRSIKLNNLQNLKEFYFRYYDRFRIEEGDIPSIEWGGGVTNLKSIIISGCANWFRLDKFQVFPNLKDLSLANVCLSGISFFDFWCYFPSLEDLKFTNCYGFEEIQILSHSIQHISLTGINRSIKARIDAPNILSFKFSAKYIPATLSFAKTHSKWKSDINLKLDDVDDSLWLKQLSEMLAGGLSQSKISLDLYKLPYHHHHHHNNDVVHFEPVEVEELKFPFEQNYSSTAVINDLFCVCRPKNVDVCWYANEDAKYEGKSNEFTEHVCKILMEASGGESSTSNGVIINQESLWQKDLKEVSMKIYNDTLDEWRRLHGTSLRKCALPDDQYLHVIRFQLEWRRKAVRSHLREG